MLTLLFQPYFKLYYKIFNFFVNNCKHKTTLYYLKNLEILTFRKFPRFLNISPIFCFFILKKSFANSETVNTIFPPKLPRSLKTTTVTTIRTATTKLNTSTQKITKK